MYALWNKLDILPEKAYRHPVNTHSLMKRKEKQAGLQGIARELTSCMTLK